MIVTFCSFGWHGTGGHRVNTQIANGLVRRGHRVNVVVPEDSFADVYGLDKKVTVIRTRKLLKRPPYPPYFDLLSSLFLFMPWIPKSDVLVFTYFLPALSVLISSRVFKRGKCVYMPRDDASVVLRSSSGIVRLFRAGYRVYFRSIYRYFGEDTMTVMSEATNNMLREYCGKRGTVINGAIDSRVFHPRKKNVGCRRRHVLYVTHYESWKGIEDTARAMDIVYGTDKDVELVTVGSGTEESVSSDCPERAFGFADSRSLARLYSIADVFVYPSSYEGFGLCGLESMACGTPVVLTDSGGVREYAVDGENCLMVPPGEPRLLAEAILRVLNDDELSQRLSREGIKTARQFSVERMVDRYEEFLERARGEHE